MKFLTTSKARLIADLAEIRLANFLRENGLESVVLGISGGVDSAVMAALGLRAVKRLQAEGYPIIYRFFFMDADSASGDYEKALDLADDLDFNIEYIDLTEWYQSSPLINLIPPGHPREKIARGNIKCRLRMITHYHLSQLFSGVYLDTDDLSEEYMGFWTKHGDEGDVKVIQHLTKDEVYDLGEYLGVSQSILSAPPGDGLKVTASSAASDQLGMSYTHTDYIMSRFTLAGFDLNGKMSQLDTLAADDLIPELARETGQPEEKVEKVIRQALRTAYKRRYGDNVLHLLPSRTELGLPDFGTDEFNQTYLAAINASR